MKLVTFKCDMLLLGSYRNVFTTDAKIIEKRKINPLKTKRISFI
jgi:hypothetical protein